MEKGCELCSKAARMYCDSDQARLCWDCDEKVHSANFLVAKHSRSLLCHVCQSPTPWKASGTKLGPTISICESCFDSSNAENPATMRIGSHVVVEEQEDESESLDHYSESDQSDEEYSDDSADDDEDIEEEDEEDGENQVVPWSSISTPSSSAPPLTTSSSSEHGSFSTRDGGAAVSSALKRSRDNSHMDSEDEDACCSSQVNLKTSAVENRRASFRSLKMARGEDLIHRQEREIELMRRRRRMELLGSFMSFQERTTGSEHNASEVIRRIAKLSRDAV